MNTETGEIVQVEGPDFDQKIAELEASLGQKLVSVDEKVTAEEIKNGKASLLNHARLAGVHLSGNRKQRREQARRGLRGRI